MTTNELKPCPFCGKDELDIHTQQMEVDWFAAYLLCKTCGMQMVRDSDTEQKALNNLAKAWNTRAAVTDEQFAIAVHDGDVWRKEQTCEMVFNQLAGMYQCSECGTYSVTAAWNKQQGLLNYCMGCGAKVV